MKGELYYKLHFCARFLRDHQIDSWPRFKMLLDQLAADDVMYDFVRVRKVEEDVFERMAIGLNTIWPDGEKVTERGRYRWRDTIDNTRVRLAKLWDVRKLPEVSVDDVLSIARMYVSQFDGDRKYMKLLKRWIIDSDDLKGTYSSHLADAIESGEIYGMPEMPSEDAVPVEENYEGGGRLC